MAWLAEGLENRRQMDFDSGGVWDEVSAFFIAALRDIKFKLQKKKYIGLDMGLFEKIRNKARKLHKSEDLLITEWLLEKAG